MARKPDNGNPADLPECVKEFVRQVTGGMRHRKKAREEVQAELVAHFEEELKGCADAAEKEQKQRLAAWLAEKQELFDLIGAGAEKPHYWRTYEGAQGMISVLLPYVGSYRHVICALGHRAELLAEAGRQEDALATIRTCYRYGRHVRAGNKSLVEQIRGSYPENLAELVAAGYHERVPVDPWRGGPLTYKRTGVDFLLYGWGEDFTDDGGQRGKDDDGSWQPYWAGNGDWVFWPVARARD